MENKQDIRWYDFILAIPLLIWNIIKIIFKVLWGGLKIADKTPILNVITRATTIILIGYGLLFNVSYYKYTTTVKTYCQEVETQYICAGSIFDSNDFVDIYTWNTQKNKLEFHKSTPRTRSEWNWGNMVEWTLKLFK